MPQIVPARRLHDLHVQVCVYACVWGGLTMYSWQHHNGHSS